MTRDELLRTALRTDDTLDDLTRARIWSRVEDRLAVEPARPWWHAPRMIVAAGGMLALGALVLVLAFALRDPAREPSGFSAPRDATLAVKLGPYARASLVGPARVELVGAPGPATAIALRTGTLVAEFEGGPGRSLRIEAPGATIEIVGTLFAVEARPTSTCVAVAHGRVRMTTFARVIEIGGGESACSDMVERRPISHEMHELLARHAAVIAATSPRDVAPAPVVTATPVPPPAPTTAVAAIETRAPEPSVPERGPASRPTAPVPSPPRTPTPSAVHADVDVRVHDQVHDEARAPNAAAVPVSVSVSEPEPESVLASASASASAPGPASAPETTRTPTSMATSAASTPAPVSDVQPAARAVPAPPVAPARADLALYRDAESALARRDLAAADRALAALVDQVPASPLVDQALYERARIASQRHAWDDARGHLARLAALAQSPLREPGAYLACRIAIESRDPGADAQLAAYRASYPHSPHDLDVLGLLVDRAYRAGGCARAAPLVDELARLYQGTTLARGWRTRCP